METLNGEIKEFLPDAVALAGRVDLALEVIRARFGTSKTPDQSWQIFSSEEINKRMDERQAKAMERNKSDLAKIELELRDKLTAYKITLKETLRPNLYSFIDKDREMGYYNDAQAERVVRALIDRPEKIRDEYQTAMEDKNVDYATALIQWVDRLIEFDNMGEIEILVPIKAEHEQKLDLAPIKNSIKLLTSKWGDVDTRGRLFAAGYADLSGARNIEEYERMLKASGLA